jgi:hypothetical protein
MGSREPDRAARHLHTDSSPNSQACVCRISVTHRYD